MDQGTRLPPFLRPGSLLRGAVSRVTPTRARRWLRRRLAGTALFPANAAPQRVLDLYLACPPADTPAADTPPADTPAADTSAGDAATGTALRMTAPRGLYVPRLLEQSGLVSYEPRALECFLALVERSRGGAVFDVGANVGVFGLLAAVYGSGPVRAFEPFPGTADVARRVAARHGLDMVVEEIALGESTGSAQLYLSAVTDSSHSLNARFRRHSQELTVPVERLDDYCARTGVVPAVLKVDTESTEPQVLAGAGEVLRRHRPWVLVEVLHGRIEESLAAVMEPYGYIYYHLDGAPPRPPTDRFVGDPSYEHLMYLLSPEPVDDALWEAMMRWRKVLDRSRVRPVATAA